MREAFTAGRALPAGGVTLERLVREAADDATEMWTEEER